MNSSFGIVRCTRSMRQVLQKYFFATKKSVCHTKTLQYQFLNFFKRNDWTTMHTEESKLNMNMNNSMQSAYKIVSITNDISNLLDTIESANNENEIILHNIDKECCDIVQKLSYTQILQLLNILGRKFPTRVTRMQFYKKSIQILINASAKQMLSHLETMELLFYLSMNNKNSSSDVRYITKGLLNINNMSLMDQTIIAYAAFKTYVKLNAVQVRVLERTLEKNASFFVKDPALLVTLCKAIRHAGVNEQLSLNNLSRAILSHQDKFTMKCAAHVLALYAEANTCPQPVLKRMFKDSMAELSDNNIHDSRHTIRIKDMDRLLWAGSRLNYEMEVNEFSEIQLFIRNNIFEYSKEVNLLVNTLLCLRMFGDDCKKIIVKCLEENILLPVYEGLLWKPKARLQLLITSVRIENPEIRIPMELTKEIKVGNQIGNNIVMLLKVIRSMGQLRHLDHIRIEYPILGLYIPGISMEHRNLGKIHIDVLDEITCLKNTTTPHGLMNFKLRLLKELGYCSVLIDNDQLKNEESIYEVVEQYLIDFLRNDNVY